MFGLFSSTRAKATKGAIAALQPMMGTLQVIGGPGVPSGLWEDPYILGYVHLTIGAWAKFMTSGKVVGEDLGFALQDTLTAITNMNGKALAQRANALAIAGDPEFLRGQENATIVFLYGHGLLKDEDSNAVVRNATKQARVFGANPSRSQIAGSMMSTFWVGEVKRVAKKRT